MRRKRTRADESRLRFEQRKHAARTPRELLDVTWDRVLTVLVALAKADSRVAEDTCRDLADQLELIADDIDATATRIRQESR